MKYTLLYGMLTILLVFQY